jgi:hypothetical protein
MAGPVAAPARNPALARSADWLTFWGLRLDK